MKILLPFFLLITLSACTSRGASQNAGGVNPFLWRASIETLANIPLASSDSRGGLLISEWQEQKAGERIKLSVAVLTSDLRADGVRVSVFRQTRRSGRWVDSAVSTASAVAIENLILTKARGLRLGIEKIAR